MLVQDSYLHETITWQKTEDPEFPYKTVYDDRKLTIRLNDFPAENLYTLFVDSEPTSRFDDWPEVWKREDGETQDQNVALERGESLEWVMPHAIEKHLLWKRRRENWVPIINAVVGFLALLVIFAQASIYYKQSVFMNEQTAIMQENLKISQDSLRASEQSFHISERAYVGLGSFTTNLKAGEIEIMLQNIGHIPAKGVKLEGQEIRAIPADSDERTESGERINKEQRGSVFHWEAGEVQLFPGTPMPVVIHMQSFQRDEVNAILSKKEILYIGGTIQYEDGFGNNQSTTFAFKYDPSNDRWIAHPDLSRFFKQNER